MACVPKRTTTNNTSNPTTDAERIAALESKVSQLQSKIASLPTSSGNYDGDIDSLQAQIDDIQVQLDDILIEVDDRIAALEEKQQTVQEEEEAAADVKWSYDITSNYSAVDVTIDYWQTPSRMDDEGDYTIKVTLANNKKDESDNLVAISDLILDITYTPNGKPYVDERNTFLDTISSPYILWDTRITTRGDDKYCRRISNMSEKIKLEPGENLQLKLEFVLAYQ